MSDLNPNTEKCIANAPIVPENNTQKETDQIIKNLLCAHKRMCKTARIDSAQRLIGLTKQLMDLIYDAGQPRVKLISPDDSNWCQNPPDNI